MGNHIARILVIDDDPTNRLKMEMSVKRLGYESLAVDSGRNGLNTLASHQIDLVLLDIIMPEMDGFEVLAQMKADPMLRGIPVVVISTLEKMDAVARAIEMGAEDYLPKTFDPTLLKARVSACLEKKRTRDIELEYLKELNILANAASVLEKGKYNPDFLGIEKLKDRHDSLGKFSRVFSEMAREIYERERRLNNSIRSLKGILLLLAAGGAMGLGVPLSRMASQIMDKPFGLSIWVLFITGVICMSSAVILGKTPSFTASSIKFMVIWGFVTAVPQVLTFWVSNHIQASLLSVVLVTEGFIVFSIAALMKLEHANAKRLTGLFAGFVGVIIIILSGDKIGDINNWIWFGVALIIPSIYAIEDFLINIRFPKEWDIFAAVGCVCLMAMVILAPVTYLLNDGVSLSLQEPGKLELIIFLLAAKTLVSTVLFVILLKSMGAVFGSQVGYVKTFTGIVLSLVLLHETLPFIAWIALGIMLIGLILVEPKQEAEVRPEVESRNSVNYKANEI